MTRAVRALALLLMACTAAPPPGGLGPDGGADPQCAPTWNNAEAICASYTTCTAVGEQCLYPGALDPSADGGTTAELACGDAGYWICSAP